MNNRLTKTLKLAQLLLPVLGLVACTRGPGQGSVALAPTADFARLGTPVTGSYARGEALTTNSFNEAEGVGPVYNKNACKWCHSVGGVGGAGDVSNRVELFAAIRIGDDGLVNLRYPRDLNLLETLGGPILHRGALGDNDRLPTQAEIDAALGSPDYRLVRTARVGNPIFGTGLLSAVPNSQIVGYAAAQRQNPTAQALGITGRVHYLDESHNVIGRLGWKAQVPSTLNFIAGASVEEIGLAHNRNLTENHPNAAATGAARADLSDGQFLDMLAFNNFVAPPAPTDQNDARVRAGRAAFERAGCAVCHAASPYTTGDSATAPLIPTAPGFAGDADLYRRESALHNRRVNAFSDLLLHDMGVYLADGFNTGAVGDEDASAKGAEWKTAALWGLRLKKSYLHDGRTNDLGTAVRMHAGPDGSDSSSEAYKTIQNYLGRPGGGAPLNATERDNLLRFLRSL